MARYGENIHKRKDGRWEGRYIKGHREKKTLWGYVYGHTYAEVRQVLLRRKAEYGFFNLTDNSLIVAALAELYLHSIRCSIKESTCAHYQYTLYKYILPVLGNRPLAALNEQMLEEGVQQIISAPNGEHRPLGHSSAKECLSMVRRLCRYAARLHLLRPMELCVRLPRARDAAPAPLPREEQEQLHRFILNAPTPRKLGVLLGMELGLRIGEICGLKWNDFDLNAGTLQVQRTVSRISCGNGHTRVVIQTPKTRTSCRELPLPKPLLFALKKLRGNCPADAWFLSGSTEKPVEPRCYRKSIHACLKQAKVQSVRPHALRHTFATACLQAGCDLKTLSELLGHANAATTLQHYAHTDMRQKQKVIERLFFDHSGAKKGRPSKKAMRL